MTICYGFFEFNGKKLDNDEFHLYHSYDPPDESLEDLITPPPFVGLVAFGQTVIHTATYRDTSGDELFRVIITRTADGREIRHIGRLVYYWLEDMFCWSNKITRDLPCIDEMRPDKPARLVIYNEQQINNSQLVFLVEDERDADALGQLGIVATTHPNGLSAFTNDFFRSLWGPKVAIVPGNSEDRFNVATDLATRLTKAGLNVAMISMPYSEGQVTLKDHIAQSWPALKADGTNEQQFAKMLTEMATQAPCWGNSSAA